MKKIDQWLEHKRSCATTFPLNEKAFWTGILLYHKYLTREDIEDAEYVPFAPIKIPKEFIKIKDFADTFFIPYSTILKFVSENEKKLSVDSLLKTPTKSGAVSNKWYVHPRNFLNEGIKLKKSSRVQRHFLRAIGVAKMKGVI